MNISEFAKIAGVSKSAVSRYFNDGYLSQDKREKIEADVNHNGLTGLADAIAKSKEKHRREDEGE